MYPYAFYLTKKVKELTITFSQFVGSKAKGGVSKQVNLRNRGESQKQTTLNFPKKEHLLPPDTYTYVCILGGKKCSFFGKFCMLYFFVTFVLILFVHEKG